MSLPCYAAGVLCPDMRLGRWSLSPDAFDLFWCRPFWLTCSLWDYSAKLFPSSLVFPDWSDQYSLVSCLYLDHGPFIKPRAFPDILGDKHSSTLIDNSLSHAHCISGKGHKSLANTATCTNAIAEEVGYRRGDTTGGLEHRELDTVEEAQVDLGFIGNGQSLLERYFRSSG
jgi:hypothetical protein